jgi:hypothetical protein
MMSQSMTDSVRHRIREWFEQFGAAPGAPMHETILIKAGYFCGRRFSCDGLTAVWFVEENQVKVYDRQGKLLAVRVAWENTRPVFARAA